MATGSDQYFPGFEFSAVAEVEGVIRAAMQMGLPQDEEMRPRFFFDSGPEWAPGTRLSATGAPFGNETPVSNPETDGVLVLCAYEEREGEADETTVGSFEAKEYVLTFLPAEWDKVVDGAGHRTRDFTYVLLGGKRYKRSYPLVPYGLHDSGAVQIRVEADDI